MLDQIKSTLLVVSSAVIAALLYFVSRKNKTIEQLRLNIEKEQLERELQPLMKKAKESRRKSKDKLKAYRKLLDRHPEIKKKIGA